MRRRGRKGELALILAFSLAGAIQLGRSRWLDLFAQRLRCSALADS